MSNNIQPSEVVRDRAVKMAFQQYRLGCSKLPKDFLEYSHFLRVVDDLNMKASPGVPLCHQFGTNAQLFGENEDGELDPVMVEMVWRRVQFRLDALRASNLDCDDIRLFIKREPHSEVKLVEGRLRLISSVSVIDQIIDHMLFDHNNKQEIANALDVPSKAGWSTLRGGWKFVPKSWVGYDKSSWDWTVPWWLCEDDLRLRVKMTIGYTEEWLHLATLRYRMLFYEPVFHLSNGRRFKQASPGVMKSGCVNTSSSNSHMQVLLHAVACLETGTPFSKIWAMGDDTLQPPVSEEYLDVWRRVARMKESHVGQFCGHDFAGGRVMPTAFGKHITNLLYTSEFPSAIRSLQYLYARDSRFARFQELALELAPEAVVDRETALELFDED